MNDDSLLIYGAYGYTGELIAREAVRRGARPTLSGRDEKRLTALAASLGLPHRLLELANPPELEKALAGFSAVLHCAGPFSRTSRPMADACLAAGVHYLDITGEIGVFEALFARHREAESRGVTLLPGVGFDVVPSDCLAARLAEALPGADELRLAFFNSGGSMSRGTLKTMVESFPATGAVRRGGRIVPVPVAWDVRQIDFSCGPKWAMTIPWGDVSTAYHSTGIPDIRIYAATPPKRIKAMKRLAMFNPLLGLGPVKRLLARRIDRGAPGPDSEVRARARTYLWGEIRRGDEILSATLDVPEGYSLTAATAVEAALRVTRGEVDCGFQTPSRAFGADFIDGFSGVDRGPIG